MSMDNTGGAPCGLDADQLYHTVGRLSRTIAHDLNNHLTILWSCTEAAQFVLGQDHELAPDLEDSLEAVQRATDLVALMLLMTRTHDVQQTAELWECYTQVEPIIKMAVGRGASLSWSEPLPPPVELALKPYEVRFLLTNAIERVRKLLPEATALTLRAAPDDGSILLQLNACGTDGRVVEFSLAILAALGSQPVAPSLEAGGVAICWRLPLA